MYVHIILHLQINQTSQFNIILEDGKCSGTVLDYLCSRFALSESYTLYGDINSESSYEDELQWVRTNFDMAVANSIIEHY